jgi:expansin (peptidoglycan-binding protein)
MTTLLALILAIQHPQAIAQGYATWYDDGPGLYGAVPSWHYGDRPYPLRVCRGDRCVTVIVRDFCACGDRHGRPTVIDLSPAAFSELAPLSRGVISVRLERTTVEPPATDTWVHREPWSGERMLVFWAAVLGAYVSMTHWLRGRLR